MPILNKCCLCAQLRTGGVILGWLGLLSATFSLIFTVVGFIFLEEIVEQIVDAYEYKHEYKNYNSIKTSEYYMTHMGKVYLVKKIIVIVFSYGNIACFIVFLESSESLGFGMSCNRSN